jgi:catechol 1,2-dioxygenase
MTEADITRIVLERHEDTPDPRLKEILFSLIKHLHAFAREVRLTEEEWFAGIRYLTAVGHKTDDKRQEMILLSDTLGFSALVNLISNKKGEGATEPTVTGPFYLENAPILENGACIAQGELDSIAIIRGTVRTLDGAPIPHAQLDVWQTASNGMYDVQDPSQNEYNMRGRFITDSEGRYEFRTTRPVSYPIPTDGPVGALLAATRRHPWRPAHFHAIVTAEGYLPLTTHVFDSEDPRLDSDTVFAVRPTLIKEFVRHESAAEAAALGISAPFYTLDYDFFLEPGRE